MRGGVRDWTLKGKNMNTEPETTAQPIAPEVLTPKAESAAIVPPPAGKPKRKPSVPLHPAVIAYLAEQSRRGCNGGTAGRGACKRRGDRAHYAAIARLAMLKRWGGPAGLAARKAERAKVAARKAERAQGQQLEAKAETQTGEGI